MTISARPARMLATWLIACACSLLGPLEAHDARSLTVSGYTLVRERSISRSISEYEYRATLFNPGPNVLARVRGSVGALLPTTSVEDGSVTFDNVPAGGSRVSTDTFIVRRPKVIRLVPSEFVWAFSVNGSFTIGDYALVRQRHINSRESEFDYVATLSNRGPTAIDGASAVVVSTLPAMKIVDRSLSFGRVPAGRSVRSKDTFTVRQHRALPFTPSVLGWTIVPTAHADNRAPVVSAGPDVTVTLPGSATLAGSVTDDGRPAPLTIAWSKFSGPGAATFVAPSSASTAVSFSAPGTYVLRLTASDGAFSRSDDVTVKVSAANQPPLAKAGEDSTVAVGQTAQLNGSASSDPEGAPLVYAWSFVSRPPGSSATLSSNTAPNPTFLLDVAGDYVVQLTVNDGLTSSPIDTVRVHGVWPSVVVGAAGGTVEAPGGGFNLSIPPGALAESTTITISPVHGGEIPEGLDGVSPLGPMWSLEPHGLTFSVPVTINLSYGDLLGQVASPDEIGILHWDSTFVDVASAIDDAERQTLSVEIESFSTLGMFRRPSGSPQARMRWSIPLLTTTPSSSFGVWAQETGGVAFTTVGPHQHIVVHGPTSTPSPCPSGYAELRDALVRTCLPSLTRPLDASDQVHIWLIRKPSQGGAAYPEPNPTVLTHAIGHALGLAHPWRLLRGDDDDQPHMAPIQLRCTDSIYSSVACMSGWRLSSRGGLHQVDVDALRAKYGAPLPQAPAPLSPLSDAQVPQNDPSNGCSLIPGQERRGFGLRIPFEWTSVSGVTQYHLVAKSDTALNPLVDFTTSQTSYVYVNCNGFAPDSVLRGWSWRVQSFANGIWGPFSTPRAFEFSPCRLPDGSACDAAPGPYPVLEPDLTISVSDGPDPVMSSGALTYSIVVTNQGNGTASGVTFTDTLSSDVTFTSCVATQGTCSYAAGTVSGVVGSLLPGASATISILVSAPSTGATVFVGNSANATSSSAETDLTNNQASATTTISTTTLGGGPRGANVNAMLVDPSSPDTIYLGTTGGVFKSTSGGAEWATVNTGFLTGSVGALAFDPTSAQILYAGTVNGVSKTTNGGASWTTLNAGLTTTHVQDVAVDRTNPSIVYVGTSGGGLFKSVNAGGAWVPSNTGLTNLTVLSLAASPTGVVYLGTSGGGLFRSTDSGDSWVPASVGLTDPTVVAITVDPANPAIVYAGTPTGGVFKSIDGGVSWAQSSTGLTRLDVRAIAIDPRDSSTLYAAVFNGVAKSVDAGANWAAANNGLRVLAAGVPGGFAVAFDPSRPSTVYLGTSSDSGVFKTVNDGADWVPLNAGLNATFSTSLVLDPASPTTLYVGTRTAAVFKSNNKGGSWATANSGFFTILVTSLAIDPSNTSVIYAGTLARGIQRSIDGGSTWVLLATPLTSPVVAVAVDPTVSTTLYAATTGQGFFISLDAGVTWIARNSGLTNTNVLSMAIDPQNSSVIYLGTQGGVFKSVNAGLDWASANAGVTNATIATLAINPATPTVLYAGTSDGLFKTTNGGANWTGSGSGIPAPANVQAIAIDPVTPTTLYATRPGTSKVFRSSDGGQTWTNSSTGLPVLPMSLPAIKVDPTDPLTIYVATTGAGVFRSTDGGTTWHPTGSNAGAEANAAPVVDAGPDVAVTLPVNAALMGSVTDDGLPAPAMLTTAWSQVSGPGVTAFAAPGNASTTAAFSTPGTYVLRLTASDGVLGASDETTVTVTAANVQPVADAGPDQAAPVGTLVTLTGIGSSDANGDPLTHLWTFSSIPAGSAAVLINPTSATPSFTIDAPGSYTAQLIVNDGALNSAPDTITVSATNSVPIANAGADQSVLTGVTVTLTGSGSSDPEGSSLTYSWVFTSKPAGSTAVLTNGNGAAPTFVADMAGAFVVELTVTDSVGATATDSIVVTVTGPTPVVSILATDATASETGPDVGTFTVTRTGDLIGPLVVQYVIGGSATTDADFAVLAGSVTIQPGQATATIAVVPVNDAEIESAESVVATISQSAEYIVGAPDSAAIAITDDDVPVVAVVASGAVATETGPTVGAFTISRTGPVTAPLVVNFTLSGTSTSSVDFASLGLSAVIPVGQGSVTLSVAPADDAEVEGDETATLTLVDAATYDLAASPVATVIIVDNDLAVVSVAVPDSNASEVGPDAGLLRLSRTGGTALPLTVTFTLGGTATNGTDYANLGTAVTFAVGQAELDVSIAPVVDSTPEGSETVTLALVDAASYDVGSSTSGLVAIADSSPTVAVTATDSAASEDGPDIGTFTFTRSGGAGDINPPLIVNFNISGSATSGSDYVSLSSTVIIPAGQASTTLTVTPLLDDLTEGAEDVSISLAVGAYVSNPTAASVNIQDSTLPVITVAATDASASEVGLDPGTLTFTRTGDTALALNGVTYTRTGTASPGVDFVPNLSAGGTVDFEAGQSTVVVVITPLDDALVEGAETIIVTLTSDTHYRLGAPATQTATVTLADQPAPVVTVVATSGSEVGPISGSFTFTRIGSLTASLPVSYTLTGTATSTVDFGGAIAAGTVTIPSGQTSVTVDVPVLADDVTDTAETALVTLLDGAAYDLGTPSSATMTVVDDPPVITIVTTDPIADELGSGTATFTVSRGGATTSSRDVLVTVSGSATLSISGPDYSISSSALTNINPSSGDFTVRIPAGEGSVTIIVTPFDDGVAEGDETVSFTAEGSFAAVRIADPGPPTVTIVATTPTVTEGGAPESFTVTRTGSLVLPLGVNLQFGGTAVANLSSSPLPSPGSDFTASSGLISQFVIPTGAASGVITISALADAAADDGETITVTILDGGTPPYVIGTPGVATMTVVDTPAPIVTVVATTATVTEGGVGGGFVVTRTGPLALPLSVNLSFGGAAAPSTSASPLPTPGSDFTADSGVTSEFVIPAGAASATVTITALDDAVADDGETVTVTILDGGTPPYAIGTPSVATMTILDAPAPVVTIVATTATAEEGGAPGQFTVTRTGSVATPLSVNLSFGGTAGLSISSSPVPTPGSDFTADSGVISQFVIPAGSASATVTITALADAAADDGETVTVTILDGGTPPYVIGTPSVATMTIVDAPAPVVTIVASTPTAEEGGVPGQFTVTRTGLVGAPLSVNLSFGGTATLSFGVGGDYTADSGVFSTFVIPAGAASATVTITALADAEADGGETVTLTIIGSSGAPYAIGTPSEATVTMTEATASLAVAWSGASQHLEPASVLSMRLPSASARQSVTQ